MEYLKMILRQQQSADPDCMGSKSRQYIHISGQEYTCTGPALCPYRRISCVLLAQNCRSYPPSHCTLHITYYFMDCRYLLSRQRKGSVSGQYEWSEINKLIYYINNPDVPCKYSFTLHK